MNQAITSLFSGGGGLDLGFHGNFEYLNQEFEKLNFETIFANDIDKNACITFSKNFNKQIICDDIRNIEMNNLEKICRNRPNRLSIFSFIIFASIWIFTPSNIMHLS